MYIRFITEFTNDWDERETGVFQAMGHLIRSPDVFDYDRERLKEIRAWFDKELERPSRFNKHSNKHKSQVAISWYRDTAKEHLENMYDLIPIFDTYNIQVEVIKKENPGYKVYEDEFHVVTIPHGKEKGDVL